MSATLVAIAKMTRKTVEKFGFIKALYRVVYADLV